jgi:hypothetical protein
MNASPMHAIDDHEKIKMIENNENPEMNFGNIESFEEKIVCGITEHQGLHQQILSQDRVNADQAIAIICSLNSLEVYVQGEHSGGQRRDGVLQAS